MGRRRKIFPKLENLEIIDAGSEGKAVGRKEEQVVFVPFAVPGDILNVQVVKKKRSFMEAKIIDIVKKSDIRIEPKCSHFSVCGGCKWQNMTYAQQLVFKQKQVADAMNRIGKIDTDNMLDIKACEQDYYYRNKLEYTFSNLKWLTEFSKDIDFKDRNMNGLGFHIPGMFDRIVDIEHCYLQAEPSNKIRLAVKNFALENDLSFYNIRKKEGFLRNLIVRNSNTGDLMIIVVFFFEDVEKRKLLLDFLKSSFPEITSLYYVINEKANDSISDLEAQRYDGKSHMIENMEHLQFKIGPKSFFQTNSKQAYELYKITREFADLQGDELVYDLYTGTGTIANFVAHQAKKVIGIEYVEEAVVDAKLNAELNELNNTAFFAGDMAKVLDDDFVASNGQPDVIITDPPRAGMHASVVEMILKLAPQKVVYVSCNPATQARDLALMTEQYNIVKMQPVDMFPQTAHVENVALLLRK